MPNWCENYLKLEVPTKQDADIIEAVLNENEEVYEEFRKEYIPKGCGGMPFWGEQPLGLLGYLMPEPDYKEGDEKLVKDGINHIFPDWYSWRVDNWGTKWEVSIDHWERDDNDDGSVTFNFNFDSAWGPPTGVYDYVSANKEDWDIYATYIEGGMCFGGYFENGQDCSFELGSRDVTDAPAWWVDDYSWYYDQQEEWEMENDVETIKIGDMTHDAFIKKWGVENYNHWSDLMTPTTDDPVKKVSADV